jgi:hypothetical protein
MFLHTELETLLPYFDKLTAETKPLWGSMTAQRMVEHLTDTLLIACGENPQSLVIPEDKIPGMLRFLDSDKPMAKDIQVPFALPDTLLRHEELELAVDEYVDIYLQFEELYESNPELTHIHPYYGPLNHAQWTRLHSKHVTHHFTQFGLVE